jgi:hypothetical protein
MRLILSSLAKRSDERIEHDRAVARWAARVIDAGGTLDPKDQPEER